MNLEQLAATYLPQIEADLADVLQQHPGALRPYYGMMRYHLGWVDASLQPVRANAGKRLRPLLCLLSCQVAGGDPAQALPAASAVELVHSFSLVHDDIEDGSQMRRGRPAVWDIWGAAHAINVGDGLFVLARMALHRLGARGVPLERCQAAFQALDSACLALCEGQFQDMSFQDRVDVDLDQYLVMIHHKTAALLAASAQIGALVAVGDADTIARLRSYGENLGMAFQVQDDILGIWGEEGLTGKSVATDLRDKKKTLPIIHALRQERGSTSASQLAALYAQPEALNEEGIKAALAILESAHSRSYAEAIADRYLQLSLSSLVELPSPAERVLGDLARSLVGRRA